MADLERLNRPKFRQAKPGLTAGLLIFQAARRRVAIH